MANLLLLISNPDIPVLLPLALNLANTDMTVFPNYLLTGRQNSSNAGLTKVVYCVRI